MTDGRQDYAELIERVIAEDKLRVVFQPLLDLQTNKPFAFEALVRCQEPGLENPMRLFEVANDAKLCGVLGRRIRELATQDCPDRSLFLNIHPSEFADGWLVRPDDPIFSHEHPIYLEVTEAVPLSHYEFCSGVLSEVRSKGLFLAVDDLGAGYSNLKYIADLAPEIVKLDRELVSNLRTGSRLHKLVSRIVDLCVDLGSRVVAEGIETQEELAAIRETGVHFGQGYFIARPANPPPPVVKFGLEPPQQDEPHPHP